MEVLSEQAVSACEAKDILEKKIDVDGATYEQKIAADHLKKNIRLEAADAQKIAEELNGLDKLGPEHIAQVVNVLPKEEAEVEMLFKKERIRLSDEDMKKITDAVKKYA